jgi:hypothetical protein
MTAAAIAYRRLPPATKVTVDELLTHHPAAAKWDADRAKHEGALEPGLDRFLRASTWPDAIKFKKGVNSHASWHYTDYPLRGPASPFEASLDKHDLLEGMRENESVLRDASASPEARAVALSWLIHLIGDLHQPLHCATLVNAAHPTGDGGGNDTVIVIDGRHLKLHTFWDGLLGKSRKPSDAQRLAVELEAARAGPIPAGFDARAWTLEARTIAQTVAYPRAVWDADNAVEVDEGYIKSVRVIAEQQVALAGRRLAVMLSTDAKISAQQPP